MAKKKSQEFELKYKFYNGNKNFVIRFQDVVIDKNEKNEKLLLNLIEKTLPSVLKDIINAGYVGKPKFFKFTILFVFSNESPDILFGIEDLPFDIPYRSNAMECLINVYLDVFFYWYAHITTGKPPRIKHKIIGDDFWEQFES